MSGSTPANVNPIFEANVKNAGVEFTSADATSKKTVYTGNSSGNNAGSRIDSLMISTSDTSDVNLAFYVTVGGTDYYIGVVKVPTGSGYTTVPRVEGLTTLSPTTGYFVLGPGDVLKAACVATMTAAKVTDVVAQLGDY